MCPTAWQKAFGLCCQCACFKPDQEKLIFGDHACLCCLSKGQFPFGGDTPEPICAVYGLQCAQKDKVPVFGACTQPYTPGVCNPIMEKLAQNKTVEVSGGAPPTEQIERSADPDGSPRRSMGRLDEGCHGTRTSVS